ncbi:6310_t:CDS:2 [Entrophospora sp. SA101]|nr:578_t:CDS:2 [Entrophospora sp. SA101]CAJ0757820.1 6310_t:CDS:2 [Entrophospora sp. SA101]
MSIELCNEIYVFLRNAEECQINATSVIYLGMKEDRWIPKNELRSTINRAVTSARNAYVEGSSRHLRILRISSEKPARLMKPTLMPRVKEICREFVSSFSSRNF